MSEHRRHILVIGGGAAGMAAALAAARAGCRVSLFEKNEKLGKKLFITGKGRCNVTNACPVEELFDGVVTNSRFLYSSIYGFSNQDLMNLLEDGGLRLKVERGNRVFPQSDKSSDVIRTWERLLRQAGVEIHLNAPVKGIWMEDGRCRGIIAGDGPRGGLPGGGSSGGGPRGNLPGGGFCGGGRQIGGDGVIVATGGLSYPSTGSTGDGFSWAREAGHQVTELLPALVPFVAEEAEDVRALQGLSLKNVEALVHQGKRRLFCEQGEMLFTHFGVSGPLMLSASSFCAKALKKSPLALMIDLKPALSAEQLDARILRDFSESANKQFKNSLDKLYPAKLIPVMIRRSGIDPEKRVNAVTREERQALVQITKSLCFTLTGLRGFNEAIITQGGVAVKEIDPGTMESKKVPGLYFAGEVLDLDAVTGGYNLQIAWSTGWAAGVGAAGEVLIYINKGI